MSLYISLSISECLSNVAIERSHPLHLFIYRETGRRAAHVTFKKKKSGNVKRNICSADGVQLGVDEESDVTVHFFAFNIKRSEKKKKEMERRERGGRGLLSLSLSLSL